MLSVDDVNAILRLPLLGVIADEPQIISTTNRGEPIALDPASAAGAAYAAIARRISGEDSSEPDTMPGSRSFLSRLTAFFGGRG